MQLERGRVVSVGERVRQGSMYPIYTELLLGGGRYVRCISKFPAAETRAPAEAPVNEWMGTVLAHRVGLQVPPCYLAEASRGVAYELSRKHGLTLSASIGFASVLSPIAPVIYPYTLEEFDAEDLARLFCFDMLFVNADRTPENPNCGHGGGKIFAYDFGSSLLAPNTTPSSFDRPYFGSNLFDRAEAHLCRSYVGSADLVQRILADMINRISDCHWARSLDVSSLPTALQEHMGLLIQFLEFLGKERDMVSRQIVSTI